MRQNRRQHATLCIPALLVLGLGSRLPSMPQLIIDYAGDVLWGTLFYVLFVVLAPRARTVRVWLLAVGATELIEWSQRYHPLWLDRIRSTPLGGLLLGHVFVWSDVVCVALGASAAALFDTFWRNSRVARQLALTRAPRTASCRRSGDGR